MAVGGAALGLTVLGKGGILNNGVLGGLAGGVDPTIGQVATFANNYVTEKEMALIRENGAMGSTIAKLEAEKYADKVVELKFEPREARVCALETAAAVNAQAGADYRRYVDAEFVHQPKARFNSYIVTCEVCGCNNGTCGCHKHERCA